MVCDFTCIFPRAVLNIVFVFISVVLVAEGEQASSVHLQYHGFEIDWEHHLVACVWYA